LPFINSIDIVIDVCKDILVMIKYELELWKYVATVTLKYKHNLCEMMTDNILLITYLSLSIAMLLANNCK